MIFSFNCLGCRDLNEGARQHPVSKPNRIRASEMHIDLWCQQLEEWNVLRGGARGGGEEVLGRAVEE